jgi:copper chaperone
MPIQFTVPDMACGACASTIEQAIKQLDPAATFTADTPHKTITITTHIAAADLQQAIEQAGYHPAAMP